MARVSHFKSVFSRCIFDLNHSAESVWIGLSQACTSGHCNFTPFFCAKVLQLCQVAQGLIGHSITFILLSLNPFCVAFGSLSFLKINMLKNILSLSSIPSSSRISLYFGAFILPSTLTSLPEPAAKKHPHSMMLPPPCFMLGRVCLWWCAVFGGLIWLKKLLPVDLGVSHQPFREL